MKSPKNILVVITRRIGDVLLTTPLIHSIKQAWPEAMIDVLVFAGTEGILEGNPDVNQVITISRQHGFSVHLECVRRLWRKYDIALSTLSGDRPSLLARIAGKRSYGEVDAGLKSLWKKLAHTACVEMDNLNTHTVLMHLKLADILGIPRCTDVVCGWRGEDELMVMSALPFDPDKQGYAVLHIHPMYAYKAWRLESWVELATWLSQQGMQVVLTGGGGGEEVAQVRDLAARLQDNAVCLAGKLTLSGVAFLLSKARVYVGPDTVTTHMAAGLGVPTVALFGPSNPVKWGPWPKNFSEDRNPYYFKGTQFVNNVALLQGEGECVPCLKEGCNQNLSSTSDCLQRLPSSLVIEAVQRLLAIGRQVEFVGAAEKGHSVTVSCG